METKSFKNVKDLIKVLQTAGLVDDLDSLIISPEGIRRNQ
jgi:hypothetical protein